MSGRAMDEASEEGAPPTDLFEDEEYPARIVLCVLSAYDAGEPSPEAPEDPSSLPDAWREASQRVWGTQLKAQLEPTSQGELDDGEYVKISSTLADAERLEAAGIAFLVRGPSPGDGRNLAHVLVPRADLARAREILGIRL